MLTSPGFQASGGRIWDDVQGLPHVAGQRKELRVAAECRGSCLFRMTQRTPTTTLPPPRFTVLTAKVLTRCQNSDAL